MKIALIAPIIKPISQKDIVYNAIELINYRTMNVNLLVIINLIKSTKTVMTITQYQMMDALNVL